MIKTLGERIRELREAKDLSLREFAKELGLKSAAFLSDVELGRRHPSDELLPKMAKVFGVSIEELQKYDTRLPIGELRHLALSNPAYGIALRTVIEKRVSPDELMSLINKKRSKKQ